MSGAIMGSTAYGTGGTSASDESASKLSADMDTFLLLLTSQLQNQDPLDPMDSNEFTNQLVQYSEVEQAIQTNSNLEDMISLNISNLATNAVSYIGKEIQVDTTTFPLQDGYAKFTYTLGEEASSATGIIYDASGNIVDSFPIDGATGRQVLDWDGTTSDGEQLPDGVYRFGVSAFDMSGEMMDASESIYITTYGKATAVASDGIDIAVSLGDVVITLDRVLSIHEATAPDDVEVNPDGDTEEDTTTDTETPTP